MTGNHLIDVTTQSIVFDTSVHANGHVVKGNYTPRSWDGPCNDETPTVNRNYPILNYRVNTSTTLKALDNGLIDQELLVVFTNITGTLTVDFSNTFTGDIRGNAGVDWTPGVNDSMTCQYDGTNWYCVPIEI